MNKTLMLSDKVCVHIGRYVENDLPKLHEVNVAPDLDAIFDLVSELFAEELQESDWKICLRRDAGVDDSESSMLDLGAIDQDDLSNLVRDGVELFVVPRSSLVAETLTPKSAELACQSPPGIWGSKLPTSPASLPSFSSGPPGTWSSSFPACPAPVFPAPTMLQLQPPPQPTSSHNWLSISKGRLLIRARPTPAALRSLWASGATAVVTLLREDEPGYQDVQSTCHQYGLRWLHAPLDGLRDLRDGEPKSRAWQSLVCAYDALAMLDAVESVVLHCAAGLHRTGIFAYLLLRLSGLAKDEIVEKIRLSRPVTASELKSRRLDRIAERIHAGLPKQRKSLRSRQRNSSSMSCESPTAWDPQLMHQQLMYNWTQQFQSYQMVR